jgi:hypothetical protein
MSFGRPTMARATSLSVDDLGGASSFSATIGSQFQVGIYADTFSDLFAWQSDISWSPTVLRLDKVTEGGALLVAGNTFFSAGTIDNTAGSSVATTNTVLGPVSGASGTNGALVFYTFTAIGPGQSSITIANTVLLDSNLNNIDFTIVSGTVSVIGGVLIPEPDSFLLLVAGVGAALVGLTGVRRS